MGVRIDGQALNTAFKRFKEIADKKKNVTALDLEAIVSDEIREQAEAYNLASFEVHDSSGEPPTAKVEVTTPDGETVNGRGHRRRRGRRAATGDQRRDRQARAC